MKKKQRKFEDKEIRDIIERKSCGFSFARIAKDIGRDQETVRRVYHRNKDKVHTVVDESANLPQKKSIIQKIKDVFK